VFIIWGTLTRQQRLGNVADWCRNCRKVRAFVVTKYFRVSHLYYIPMGRGTLAGTVRECWHCCEQYHCDENKYEGFMPEKCVETMPLSELVQQTNRAVERRLQGKKRNQIDSALHDAGVPEAVSYEEEIPEAIPHQDDDSAQ
jgi:hypothetical protein